MSNASDFIIENGVLAAYTGKGGEVVVPNEVTIIDGSVFEGCTELKSVTLSNGITKIGHRAFYNCSGLENINIPEGIIYIGSECFYGCTSLKSVTLPNSLTRIEYGAFYGCSGLTSITIPGSITYITNHCFYSCTGLNAVIIPDSVKIIARGAFGRCTSLTSIIIPDGVTEIHEHAFSRCVGLTKVVLSAQLTYLNMGAFEDCCNLTSIVIPDNVLAISENLFQGCTGLTNVYLGNGVKAVDRNAFNGCTNLTSITIPDGVTDIESYAFCRCINLAEVNIPNSVTSIGKGAFLACSKLTKIQASADVWAIMWKILSPEMKMTVFVNYLSSKEFDLEQLNKGVKRAAIKIIEHLIETSACDTSVERVLEIKGKLDLNELDALIEKAGNNPTIKAILLDHQSKHYSLKSVQEFEEHKMNIQFGSVERTATEWKEIFNVKNVDGGITIISYKGKERHIEIPFKIGNKIVVSIGSRAFYNHAEIESVTIPNSIVNIEEDAFNGCTSLTNVDIPDSVTSVGIGAFCNCTGLSSVTFGSGLTAIGNQAFHNCVRLSTVTIPENVTAMGVSVFLACNNLKTIVIRGKTPQITRRSLDVDAKIQLPDLNLKTKDRLSELYSESAIARDAEDCAYLILYQSPKTGNTSLAAIKPDVKEVTRHIIRLITEEEKLSVGQLLQLAEFASQFATVLGQEVLLELLNVMEAKIKFAKKKFLADPNIAAVLDGAI